MTRAEYCQQWQRDRLAFARKADAKALAAFEASASTRRGYGQRYRLARISSTEDGRVTH